jgi:dihydropteroate synthase
LTEPDEEFRGIARPDIPGSRGRALVVGVLNATPDSFSDGGKHLDPAAAVLAAERMAAEGADWLDVGAESTRPGSARVPAELQAARLEPIFRGLRNARFALPITVDTTRASVADLALRLGAWGVNDISAGREDDRMFDLVATRRAGIVLMHMQGTPGTMQVAPSYRDVVSEVSAFLRERVEAAVKAGIDRAKIWVDPGIGFGKRVEDNLDLLRRIARIKAESGGCRVLVGASRKFFLGAITGRKEPLDRVFGSTAAAAWAAAAGADAIRAHDVAPTRDTLLTIAAILDRP